MSNVTTIQDAAAPAAAEPKVLDYEPPRRAVRAGGRHIPALDVVAVVGFAVIGSQSPVRLPQGWNQLWYWLYTSNIGYVLRGDIAVGPGLGHFWSLAIEEQFYLVWPTLVFLLPLRGVSVV